MYEHLTYESILSRMLDRVPDTLDKREGSIIYDALAPAAAELQLAYIEADLILNETFADTASRPYLIKRAAERGVVPTKATNAVLRGEFDVNIPIGSRFYLNDLTYIAVEKIENNVFKLKCEVAGSTGNMNYGILTPFEYIEDLNHAELTALLIPAEDEEETESFRRRYFASLESQAFGGNISDYKEKTNNIQGVGGVKVYPAFNGGGTVKLVLIDSSFNKPTVELINEVQAKIDPNGTGSGVGIAPIGHRVTVGGVTDVIIDVSLNITYQAGWKWQDIISKVNLAIDQYFLELRKSWESTQSLNYNEGLVIRISQIETRMLALEGILDVSGTKLNNVVNNLVLSVDEIPKRGVVIG